MDNYSFSTVFFPPSFGSLFGDRFSPLLDSVSFRPSPVLGVRRRGGKRRPPKPSIQDKALLSFFFFCVVCFPLGFSIPPPVLVTAATARRQNYNLFLNQRESIPVLKSKKCWRMPGLFLGPFLLSLFSPWPLLLSPSVTAPHCRKDQELLLGTWRAITLTREARPPITAARFPFLLPLHVLPPQPPVGS